MMGVVDGDDSGDDGLGQRRWVGDDGDDDNCLPPRRRRAWASATTTASGDDDGEPCHRCLAGDLILK